MAAIRAHLTYANVMATVAVFGILGGTAWAVGANSVGSRQIKASAVKNAELAADAVTSAKVLDDSLTGADVAEGTIGQVPSAEDSATLGGLGPGTFATAGHDHDPAYVNEGQANSIGGGMVSNPQRAIQIPLTAFIQCETNPSTHLDFVSSPTDTFPDFSSFSGGAGFTLKWDADLAPNSDADSAVCSQITVPPDFASNPSIRIGIAQVIPANPAETLALATKVHFGALSGYSAVSLPSASKSISINVGTPLAIHDSLTISLQGGVVSGAMNDAIEVLAVEFVYTAEQ
jgi:hypothetical protein